MLSHDFEVWPSEDLVELIKILKLPVTGTTPLTTLPSGSKRACFKLDLADGRILKARIVDTDADGARIEYLTSLLDRRHFPKLITRRGCVLLTEWANGASLAGLNWPLHLLNTCGSLQGSLHTVSVPVEQTRGEVRSSLKRHGELEKRIQTLENSRIIEEHECRNLKELARVHAPEEFDVGLVHGDFCSDNIVVDGHEHVHVIDNETLAIDAYDYDLARTWYRWPMSSIQSKAYFHGYGHHRSLETFLAHFPYWAISALVDSALFRLRCEPRELSTPVERLRNLLKNLRDRTDFASISFS